MPLNLDRYNQRVRSWTATALEQLRSTGQSMGIVHRSNSPNKNASLGRLRNRFQEEDGAISTIGIRMRRSLVFVHKGAGKGQGGSKGSRWINQKGELKQTASGSFGKMGTGARKAKPWFNQFMDSPEGVDELATIAAEEIGDALVNNILIQ